MKIKKIFLASSIDELEYERLNIGDYVRFLNQTFHDKGIFIWLEKCEDMPQIMVSKGSQKVLNEKIVNSDFIFVVLGEKIGEYTKDEFETAYKKFKETDFPKMSFFIKTHNENGDIIQRDLEAEKFIQKIGKELKHYYSEYSHIGDLLFNISKLIGALDIESLQFEVINNDLYCNKIKIFSLKNVTGWRNNDAILEKEKEKEALFKQLEILQEMLERDGDENLKEEIKHIEFQYKMSLDDLRKIKNDVLSDFFQMTKNLVTNPIIDERLALVYKYKEQGRFREARKLLDIQEIIADIDNCNERYDMFEQQTKEVKNDLHKEIQEKIKLCIEYAFIAEKIATTIIEWDEVVSSYIKAINQINRFNFEYKQNYELSLANAYHHRGFVYLRETNYEKALVDYDKSIEIYEKLSNSNEEIDFFENLINIYIMGLHIHTKMGNHPKAVKIRMNISRIESKNSSLKNVFENYARQIYENIRVKKLYPQNKDRSKKQ